MPPLTTLLPLEELANRPSAMEPNRAGMPGLLCSAGCKSPETCYNTITKSHRECGFKKAKRPETSAAQRENKCSRQTNNFWCGRKAPFCGRCVPPHPRPWRCPGGHCAAGDRCPAQMEARNAAQRGGRHPVLCAAGAAGVLKNCAEKRLFFRRWLTFSADSTILKLQRDLQKTQLVERE